ncbi:MAG: hypothetical protein SVX43_18830 [Cyanobacteriota bacterium]|nr:hypothetical protein [Cyanobacteriota bacterium]
MRRSQSQLLAILIAIASLVILPPRSRLTHRRSRRSPFSLTSPPRSIILQAIA